MSFILLVSSVLRHRKHKSNPQDKWTWYTPALVVSVLRLAIGIALLVLRSHSSVPLILSVFELSDFLISSFAILSAVRVLDYRSRLSDSEPTVPGGRHNVLVYVFCCTVMYVVGFLETKLRVLIYSLLEIIVSCYMLVVRVKKSFTSASTDDHLYFRNHVAVTVSYYLLCCVYIASSILSACLSGQYLSEKRCVPYYVLMLAFPVATFFFPRGNKGEDSEGRL